MSVIFIRRGLLAIVGVLRRNYSGECRKKCIVLGIETSCDDTGTAVVNSDGVVLGETVFSQQNIHLKYGGITPPRAQDLHRKNIEKAVSETMIKANVAFKDLDAIAVTNRPGLPLSLIIGLRYARYLARQNSKSLIPIHHMEAHATAARMFHPISYPFLCLLISGGHSQLTFVQNVDKFFLLGESLDDAPGEAFDKIARRLRLSLLPQFANMNGGAAIELAAKEAVNLDRYEFPLPLARLKDCQFSFSGLKNSALRCIMSEESVYEVRPDEVIPYYADFCSAYIKAVTRHISNRTQRAIEYCDRKELLPKHFSRSLVISGGVACNDFIFNSLEKMANHYGFKTYRPSKKYCSDNGVMIAWNGIERILHDDSVLEQDFEKFDIIGKCTLGTSLIDDVKKAEIQCKWIKVKL